MPFHLRDRFRFYWRAYRYRWQWDRAEVAFLRSVLRPGDTAVDVGAYKGGYTYWMHRSVGPTGHVFAFEPQATAAAYLREQVKLLRMTEVTVENVAVSMSVGTAQFSVPAPRRGASPGATLERIENPAAADMVHTTVATETLDHYFGLRRHATPIRLIKIDVEGHEMSVFHGGEQLLREHKPALLFECERRHHGGQSIAPVFEHLKSLGYRGSFFQKGRLTPVAEFDPARHQVEGRKPYINNFVFQHG